MSEYPLINVEAEAALLGALMIDNKWIDVAADKITAEDFGEAVMGRIFSAILMEHGKGKPANPVTLRPILAQDETLQELGGTGYLAQLTGSSAALIGARGFIDQIADLAARRRLAEGLHTAAAACCDHEQSVEALIAMADAAITGAGKLSDGVHQVTGAQAFDELINSYGEQKNGITCQTIPSLDELLGGLRPKHLTIGAGRPGMGKTATAISYALGAVQGGYGTLFISLEMSSVELAGRVAADLCFDGHSGVPYSCIREGRLDRDQKRKVFQAREMINDMPLYIVDAGSLTITRLAMIVRRYKRRLAARGQSLDLVIVDYLQLLSAGSKSGNRTEAVSEISRGLKVIAKDQAVHMMALSQLSREVEKRPDKRPTLSDLRESGSIEQDADTVLFLYRHEYYLKLAEPDENDVKRLEWEDALRGCEGKLDFIVAKQRHGKTGSRQGWFFGSNQAVRG